MRLQLYKSLWGVVKLDGGSKSVSEALNTVLASGYAGVECSLRLAHDLNESTSGEFSSLMKKNQLQWIPILFSSGPVDGWDPFLPGHTGAAHSASIPSHTATLARQVEQALGMGLNVPFCNLHSGHDSFPESESVHLMREVHQLEQALQVPMVHEIHRGRCTFSPWSLRRMARQLPHMKLIADYAHFTAVTETAPGVRYEAGDGEGGGGAEAELPGSRGDDSSSGASSRCAELDAVLAELCPHIHHIHARVGYENGAQVADPRVSEWMSYTRGFERWWDQIWAQQKQAGYEVTTLTPEHGPPPYQPTDPQTGHPLADIEEVNTWIGARQAQRFKEKSFEF